MWNKPSSYTSIVQPPKRPHTRTFSDLFLSPSTPSPLLSSSAPSLLPAFPSHTSPPHTSVPVPVPVTGLSPTTTATAPSSHPPSVIQSDSAAVKETDVDHLPDFIIPGTVLSPPMVTKHQNKGKQKAKAKAKAKAAAKNTSTTQHTHTLPLNGHHLHHSLENGEHPHSPGLEEEEGGREHYHSHHHHHSHPPPQQSGQQVPPGPPAHSHGTVSPSIAHHSERPPPRIHPADKSYSTTTSASSSYQVNYDFNYEEDYEYEYRYKRQVEESATHHAKAAAKAKSQRDREREEEERRGRSRRPRLLWRSTLDSDLIDILDNHHKKAYGEKVPRPRGPGSEDGRLWSRELDRSGL
ncbi:hypothetical protein T439DRAFT_361102 [Meredithblackwellia eburnea MCA 4105]